MKKFLWLLLPLVVFGGLLLNSQTHTFCPIDIACTWTGNQTFTNQTTFTGGWFNGASPIMAAQQPGADCGAKITSALTLLGTASGEVWVNLACGSTISTPINLGNNHSLKFVQGGTWTMSASITLGDASSIVGIPSSINEDVLSLNNPVVILHQANNTNLASMIIIAGQNVELKDFAVNGNNPTNPSTVCISTDTSSSVGQSRSHTHWTGLTVDQCGGDDAQLTSTGVANQAAVAEIDYCSFNRSLNGNGLTIYSSTDIHIHFSKFELNSGKGINMMNSVVWLIDSDVSNNVGGDLYAGVDANSALASFLTGGLTLVSNGFTSSGGVTTENTQSDVVINGYNGINCDVLGNTFITNNTFNTNAGTPANTISGLRIYDSGTNQIIGNKFISGAGGTLKYGLHIGNVAGACNSEPSDTSLNNAYLNSFGTAPYSLASSTDQTLAVIGVNPGSQRARFVGALGGTCPTAASAGAPCTSAALSWNFPLADGSYTFTCTLVGTMTGQPHIVKATRTSGTSITLTIAADTAVAADIAGGGEADCVAWHD